MMQKTAAVRTAYPFISSVMQRQAVHQHIQNIPNNRPCQPIRRTGEHDITCIENCRFSDSLLSLSSIRKIGGFGFTWP